MGRDGRPVQSAIEAGERIAIRRGKRRRRIRHELIVDDAQRCGQLRLKIGRRRQCGTTFGHVHGECVRGIGAVAAVARQIGGQDALRGRADDGANVRI